MRLSTLVLTSALTGLLALPAFAAGPTPAKVPGTDAIVTRTLDNGLEIIVWPDHDIPNVSYYTYYKAGGRNEYPGITGLAHYFEHMMFNGTAKRAPGSFDREMEAAGGSNNAWTSNDLTGYTNWFPRQALETIFDLEADRMGHLDFDPAVVESERGVVYSERRLRVDNDNFGALMEQVQATAYLAHPYQFPVIGWPSDIEKWTVQDLRDFYRTYYAPNNAVLVITGDVQPAEVFALADQYLALLPRQPEPRQVTTIEPPQQGERRLVLEKPGAQAPLLIQAYHTGLTATDPKIPALDMLVTVLARGDSSRLNQRMVEREPLVVDIGSYVHKGFDPGLLWIYATLPPGGDLARAETVLDEELARIANEGPSAAELAKARNLLLVQFWRGMSTINGKASALASHQVFHGDWRKLLDAPAALEAVTPRDVQALAASILQRRNRTTGLLQPLAAEEAAR